MTRRLATTTPYFSQAVTYQRAITYTANPKINTVPWTPNVRRVATSRKEGYLDLRYAPHTPKVLDLDTSNGSFGASP